jgi:RNA polymerase sigma-70 factor (ECF subfamily)
MKAANRAISRPPNGTGYDRSAMIAIYEQHNAELFRYAYRLLDDSALAEDCVSETFSRFLKAVRDGLGPVENVRAYLYRVAHNWITDYFRRQPLPLLSLDSELHAGPDANPSLLVANEMERESVRLALLRLSPEQRQVIELRFIEDWSHDAVAAALGKSVEATRTLQHRALIALRRSLLEDVSSTR